eukprot:2704687-Rhodomonas_salina.1
MRFLGFDFGVWISRQLRNSAADMQDSLKVSSTSRKVRQPAGSSRKPHEKAPRVRVLAVFSG